MTTPKQIDRKRPADFAQPLNNDTNKVMKGLGVSGGIAIGQVVALERLSAEIYPQRILKPEEVPGELRRFESAVRDAKAQLKQVKKMIGPGHPLQNHLYILDTHILLLEDRMFFQGTQDVIASEKQNAEWALSTIISTISAAFDTIEDEYLRERARDVHFVGERVLRTLMGYSEKGSIRLLPPNSVIVAHDLSPADTLQIQKESVLGFAIEMGGRTSHTAIIARSMKLPAVTGLENISRQVQTGATIIIDGSTGVVILNPDPETIFRFRQHQEVYRNYHQGLMTFGRLPAVTSDGRGSGPIMANIELMDEIDLALTTERRASVFSGPNTSSSADRICPPKRNSMRPTGMCWTRNCSEFRYDPHARCRARDKIASS